MIKTTNKVTPKEDQWQAIAENYVAERDRLSFPALLIDELIVNAVSEISPLPRTVLDYGAGLGTLSHLVKRPDNRVFAYEPMAPMRKELERINREKGGGLEVLDSSDQVENLRQLDAALCVNVFDHLKDIPKVMDIFYRILRPGGRLILSIPHPIKNLGQWVKEKKEDQWEYCYYRLDDYLSEGEVSRSREDVDGNVIIRRVVSQHRTMSTYYNCVVDSGFCVQKMHEPAPQEKHASEFPVLYTQSIRIPYFWILDCRKPD
ncbi:MAG: class I SAM-dependent methyltransferase [Cytophagales bacterium]|nr:class I SAM-dependent methyltransferase [Cytophagales bacterium]